MTARRRSVVAAALAVLVVLAGCTESPAVTRSPGTMPAAGMTPTSTGRAPDSSRLGAAKKAAGIADCPTSQEKAPTVTDGLPDAVLPCLGGGRPVRLSGLRGEPMIINVWASWCPSCRTEAPFLAEVARGATGVRVLGVDHADQDPAGAIAFAGQAGWTYAQLQDRDLVLRRDLQVMALPMTFFVRADGSIAYRNLVPFSSADQIRDLSERYLGVRP
ncbi:TlpA family protein disulfide reductase [uncultured Friedmanniella sp.]|uniref:TlpA family protein disulfide reductase n=1 Tax=uncultured Friedmanniella sp. TaxID=335381 RepID=UPI0035CBD5C2